MIEPGSRPLVGYTVGITGHRRWEEQAEMLARRGARVVHGPTMSTSLLGDLDETVAVTRRVLDEPVDTVVLTTGIGTRSWFAATESVGLDDALRAALRGARVVARGPKAAHAARAEGLEVTWAAPGETNREVVATLTSAGVTGERVVVQRDGGPPVVAEALRAADPREVIDVPVYRWSMPADPAPARRLLELTVVDVVEPVRARLGSMVLALVKAFASEAHTLELGGERVRWQGNALVGDDGDVVELTPGEARLLAVLVDRGPTVVAKAELAEPGADDHAVEAAVARLRSKLGRLGAGIGTVRRRGYRSELRAARA